MPSWLMSTVRTAVQVAWGQVAAWLLGVGVAAPAEAPAWLTGAAVVLVTLAVTAGIRWLETRPVSSLPGRLARRAGRWLMLGMRQPTGYGVPRT